MYVNSIRAGMIVALSRQQADASSWALVDAFEQENGKNILQLLGDAARADSMEGPVPADYAEHFGEALAMMALGIGDWFTEHAWFPLMVPMVEALANNFRRAA